MPHRLAGIRFETPPPPLRDVLPRMDVAAFVGFAASGPLHCPVLIEDPDQFASIFGADAPLVWDRERGGWVMAHLAPVVRAFLRNGGRRCWVVRVADQESATTDCYPLPGLMVAEQTDPMHPDSVELRPASAWARSQGSWGDGVRVSTSLTVEPVRVESAGLAAVSSKVSMLWVQTAAELHPGAVLRLQYQGGLFIAMLLIEQVKVVTIDSGGVQPTQMFRGLGRALWFEPIPIASPIEFSTDSLPDSPLAGAAAIWYEGSTPIYAPVLKITPCAGEQLEVVLGDQKRPDPGEMMCIESNLGPIWLMVTDTVAMIDENGQEVFKITGTGLVWRAAPGFDPGQPDRCESLSLELHTITGNDDPVRLSNLDFATARSRYWGALPTDVELFTPATTLQTDRYRDLWQQTSTPRFPLAGRNPKEAAETLVVETQPPAPFFPQAGVEPKLSFSFPIGMAFFPEHYIGAYASSQDALTRGGLAHFSRALFLDSALVGNYTPDLLAHADNIRYTAPRTRPLCGLHAILSIEEATLIAVPDAVHWAWRAYEAEEPPSAESLQPLDRPAWLHNLDCEPVKRSDHQPDPAFRDWALQPITSPVLEAESQGSGTISLSWNSPADLPPDALAIYRVEEAMQPDFRGARVVYEGTALSFTIYGRSSGDYYYHVQAIAEPNFSDWSGGAVVRIGAPSGWELIPLTEDGSSVQTAQWEPNRELLAVHRALLRMCAARGDLFAVLSLPGHYREDDAIRQMALLRPSGMPIVDETAEMFVPPLGFGERSALSYGAVYHPWLTEQSEDHMLRQTPPDGAITGMIASRSLTRGAWIAPANVRLSGIVALTPPISQARWLDLLEAQINVVRQEPEGFVTLSADTLSDDPDLLQVNVRRLLHLLRRLVLRMGADFVFEPANDAFQRMVRRTIEGTLTQLFTRGAFAGRTTEAAYQVVMRNSPQDADNGRFIVDVKVAPSLPMTFLTVRLVQAGGRLSLTEER